jgi:hypothetical protein
VWVWKFTYELQRDREISFESVIGKLKTSGNGRGNYSPKLVSFTSENITKPLSVLSCKHTHGKFLIKFIGKQVIGSNMEREELR